MIFDRTNGEAVCTPGPPGWAVCLIAVLGSIACSSAPDPSAGDRNSKHLEIMVPKGGQAIGGYDPVSYFLDGEPRKGLREYAHEWRGATWLFATAKHRELFQQNPSKYAPAYGGWCAYGVAEGYAAESDPREAWTIHEGRLYLNWDAEIAEEWQQQRSRLLPESEANWSRVRRALQQGTAEIYWHDDE